MFHATDFLSLYFFTTQHYVQYMVSSCVTRQYCIETAKHGIMQTTSHNISAKFQWGTKCRWGLGSHDLLKFWESSDNISNTVQDRDIVTMED